MQQEDLLATTLAKICLSGEGSGVLKFRSQQHTFTFETLMNRQQMQWGVAIQVPFHGEELIRLDLRQMVKLGRPMVSGGGYRQLKKAFIQQGQRQQLSLIRQQLQNWAQLLYLTQLGQEKNINSKLQWNPRSTGQGQVEQSCWIKGKPARKFVWQLEQSRKFTMFWGSRGGAHQGAVNGEREQFGHYRQIGLKMKSDEQQKSDANVWELTLAFDSCS